MFSIYNGKSYLILLSSKVDSDNNCCHLDTFCHYPPQYVVSSKEDTTIYCGFRHGMNYAYSVVLDTRLGTNNIMTNLPKVTKITDFDSLCPACINEHVKNGKELGDELYHLRDFRTIKRLCEKHKTLEVECEYQKALLLPYTE